MRAKRHVIPLITTAHNDRDRTVTVLIIMLVLFLCISFALARSSLNYIVPVDGITGGGGQSMCDGYLISDSAVGQCCPVGESSSDTYTNNAGCVQALKFSTGTSTDVNDAHWIKYY